MGRKRGHTGHLGVVRWRETGEEPSIELRLALSYVKNGKGFELPALGTPVADTHAHLTSFWCVDPASALARAAAAGVAQLTTIWDPLSDARFATTASGFRELLISWIERARALFDEGMAAGAVDPSRAAPGLFDRIGYLAGVHPYGAPRYTDEVHARVREALDDPMCLGIGEIGIDYHFDVDDDIEAAPHDMQIAAMARQLELACTRNLPVELHLRHEDDDAARSSHEDALRVLRDVGVPSAGCVLHCFGEDRATMERFVDLGCHIAFGGAATFSRNEGVREAFAACPLDRILFETDCPYMAPEPIRGLECEPALICQTARSLAADRAERTGEDAKRILEAAWENARALLGISVC